MKAVAYFEGDPTVGIRSYYYELEVPPFEEEYREHTRELVRHLYTQLDEEFGCQIIFNDESLD